MKRSLLLIIVCLFSWAIAAQTDLAHNKNSLEFSLGIAGGGLMGGPHFYEYQYFACFDCDFKRINEPWFYLSPGITYNKKFGNKHELLLGARLTIWGFKYDQLSQWSSQPRYSKIMLRPSLDLTLGHRILLKEIKSSEIFLETLLLADLNSSKHFGGFQFSLKPAIGLRTPLNERLSLISTLSYHQFVTDVSSRATLVEINTEDIRPFGLGVQVGLNMKL